MFALSTVDDFSATAQPAAVGSLATERIEEEICSLAGHLFAGTARFLVLLAEFDEREGWAGWGLKSCAHWLAWRCGIADVTAREQVRVARALRRLPRLAGLFARGEISYSKVRALSRIGSEVNEDQLVAWARHGTAWQLERLVRSYRQVRATMEPDGRAKRRSLEHYIDEDGSVVINARLEPEEGTIVLGAIEDGMRALQDADPPAGSGADVSAETPDEDPRGVDASTSWQRRRADALVHVASSYLSAGQGTRADPGRALVVLHTSPDALVRDRCALDGGVPLHPETARRLACDAGIVRMADPHGISIGRRSRVVPRGMRRALVRRDRGCRFPGCRARRNLDAHHIIHWAHDGRTELINLVLLCRRHHRFVHEFGFSVERVGDGSFSFRRPDGRPIVAAPMLGEVDARGLVADNTARGLAIDADTPASLWDGRVPDYALAVEGLLALDARAAPC